MYTFQVGFLNVEFCTQTLDYIELKKDLYVSNKSERSFQQHCILSSSSLHSMSLPFMKVFKSNICNI